MKKKSNWTWNQTGSTEGNTIWIIYARKTAPCQYSDSVADSFLPF